MSKNKARIEKLESIKKPDPKIIVVREDDKRTDEELEAAYPGQDYLIIKIVRKDMSKKNIDIDEELDF